MDKSISKTPSQSAEAVEETAKPPAVPEAPPASFSEFTFELDGQVGKMDDMMFEFEGGTDTVNIDELFPDHEMLFEGEEATKSVMHWEKEDGAEFMRRQPNDDEGSADANASASASTAASATLSVSMSASLPQNESASYNDKYELYRMLQQQKIEERQMKQICLSTTPIDGLQLIDKAVDVEGVVYQPLDADYDMLIKRAKSKPIPVPKSPTRCKRRYAAHRVRVSPITRPMEGGKLFPFDDDEDFDDGFDEGVFHMSLPADHVPLDPNTPFISTMPGNLRRFRLSQKMNQVE